MRIALVHDWLTGMRGGERCMAVTVAVAVGGVEDIPIVRDGVVVAAPTLLVTLTADHRVVNGRNAAIFLTRLKEHLEAL